MSPLAESGAWALRLSRRPPRTGRTPTARRPRRQRGHGDGKPHHRQAGRPGTRPLDEAAAGESPERLPQVPFGARHPKADGNLVGRIPPSRQPQHRPEDHCIRVHGGGL